MTKLVELKDFPGYIVSTEGYIFSVNYRHTGILNQLHPAKDKNGYLLVTLWKNNKPFIRKVHRLVAEAFMPNLNNKPQVNHINGIKTDNRIQNLEWVTAKENVFHAYKILGYKHPKGKDNKHCKIVVQIKNNKIIAEFFSITEAQQQTGIHKSQIAKCCNHIQHCKTAGGFEWKYK